MRRTPYERIRHFKRLGHVLSGSGPASHSPANNDDGGPETTTTVNSKSLTAPSSTSSTLSGQQTSGKSSQVLSTTALVASPSVSLGSLTTGLLTSSLVSPIPSSTIPTSSFATLPPPSSSDANLSLASSSKLSLGAIVGIVIAIAVAVIAMVALVMRTICLRRRQHAAFATLSDNCEVNHAIIPQYSTKPAMFDVEEKKIPPQQSGYIPQPSTVLLPLPPPPPASYNNPGYIPAAPTNLTQLVTVRCTFVPMQPDELSISTGEPLRVITRYDDGWALCENYRCEQGMVPQECLEQVVSHQEDVDLRGPVRTSSLSPIS